VISILPPPPGSFFFLPRASLQACLQHGWLQRSLEGGSTFIKIRHEPSARIRCVLYIYIIDTYIHIYIYICVCVYVCVCVCMYMYTRLGTSRAENVRPPVARASTEIHVYRCEVGEDLACVSWIVRRISFSRRPAHPLREVEETCAEVPEPISIARCGSCCLRWRFQRPLTNLRNCANLLPSLPSTSQSATRIFFRTYFINIFLMINNTQKQLITYYYLQLLYNSFKVSTFKSFDNRVSS